jgi:hypothetical protein
VVLAGSRGWATHHRLRPSLPGAGIHHPHTRGSETTSYTNVCAPVRQGANVHAAPERIAFLLGFAEPSAPGGRFPSQCCDVGDGVEVGVRVRSLVGYGWDRLTAR